MKLFKSIAAATSIFFAQLVSAQLSNVEGIKPLEGVSIPKVQTSKEIKIGATFKDCSDCPAMVMIPTGSFMMGASPGEEEREKLTNIHQFWSQPQHLVKIEHFAAGKFEVTVGQFKAFASATGHKGEGCWVWTGAKFANDLSKDWRNPGYLQDDRHPVACVSWTDASSYVAWLSQKTGKSYRLLTEAEWEYVARAGTTVARYWGEDQNLSCLYSNSADQTAKAQVPGWNFIITNCNDGFAHTSPVGSYRANGFGLYDILGNVQEWTQDCWNGNYKGATTDGSAWAKGDCSQRVARGGSWIDQPSTMRSAFRYSYATDLRDFNVGFRVARSN